MNGDSFCPAPGSAGAPTEPAWLRFYPAGLPATLHYPSVPASALLESAAARFPQRAGCTLFGQARGYGTLCEQAKALAASLARLGAGPGRCVGLLLPNMPEYIVAMQATWLTGGSVLALSPLMVAEEIERLLELTGCHIVVTLDLLEGLLVGSRPRSPLEHVVVASLAGQMSWWRGLLYRMVRMRRNGVHLRRDPRRHTLAELLAQRAPPPRPNIVPEEDTALLVPTGGTTASSKVVMLTHRNLVANAGQLRHWSGGADGSESILAALPFFHAYGLTVGLLTGLAKAATVHLLPRFEPHAVLGLIERYRIELVPAVPAMLNALNRVLAGKPHDLTFMRAVISGAASLNADVRRRFESYGPQRVLEGYGLSEAGPVTHVNPFSDLHRPGTIGIPLPDTEARIVDPDTGLLEVPVGEVGELIVRGPQVMKGYFRNDEETRRVLRDGWLYTGDLARRDRDGFFTLVDRKKDIIKTSGFLVFPAEVEEVLKQFPGVAEAAVVGEPDPERGEIIKAWLVPSNGDRLDRVAIANFCVQHLGHQKRPRQIEIVTELPKNFLGKVLRRKLREATPPTPAA